MKVTLSGEPYFQVIALDAEEQLVTKKDFSEWKFTVIPKKRGKWPLHLRVSAVFHMPWGNASKDYLVKDELIQVRVTLFGAIGSFIFDNWQWIVSAIIFPLLIWAERKLRALKHKQQPAHKQHPAHKQQPIPISPDENKPSGVHVA